MSESERIAGRIEKLREWLMKEAPECFDEQLHCVEGTKERIYWHYGYLVALTDLVRLIESNKQVN